MSNRHLPRSGTSNVALPYPYKNGMEWFEDFEDWSPLKISNTANAAPWRSVGLNMLAADFTGQDAVAADGDVFGLAAVTISAGANLDWDVAQANINALCTTGRAMEFQCRFRAESITTCNHIFGMFVPATALGTTQQNGFGFRIVNGAISYEVKDADTTFAATTTGKTIAASTTTGWNRLKAVWNGIDAITFFVNDALVATYTGLAIPTGLYLAPVWGVGATAAVNPKLVMDYIGFSVEGPTAGR